jgi:hypothetical protein
LNQANDDVCFLSSPDGSSWAARYAVRPREPAREYGMTGFGVASSDATAGLLSG